MATQRMRKQHRVMGKLAVQGDGTYLKKRCSSVSGWIMHGRLDRATGLPVSVRSSPITCWDTECLSGKHRSG